MIHLEKIVGEDHRKFTHMKVKKEQENFVANTLLMFTIAYAYYDESFLYGIYNDDIAVGLVLAREYKEGNTYLFDQFMIDEKYQGKGFGKNAATLVLNKLKEEHKYDKVLLCYIDGDEAAKKLYLSLGFKHTGFVDVCDDGTREIDMELDF